MVFICEKHKTESFDRKTKAGGIVYCPECMEEQIVDLKKAIATVLHYHGEHMEDWLYEYLERRARI